MWQFWKFLQQLNNTNYKVMRKDLILLLSPRLFHGRKSKLNHSWIWIERSFVQSLAFSFQLVIYFVLFFFCCISNGPASNNNAWWIDTPPSCVEYVIHWYEPIGWYEKKGRRLLPKLRDNLTIIILIVVVAV
jgi:hypothetical protein